MAHPQIDTNNEELRKILIEFDNDSATTDAEHLARFKKTEAAIASRDQQIALAARIDELHMEADRFREAGHKGLPPGFQSRMNELQRELATLKAQEK